MSKDKKKGKDDEGADQGGGVFDDLPWAEESPAVQARPPGVGSTLGHRDVADLAGETDEVRTAGYQGPERRTSPGPGAAEAGSGEAESELSDAALEEAALIVQNDITALERERDEYLDQARRVQADFENYRKRIMQQQADVVERAAEALVGQLLPVLDACDAAVQHGADDVAPIGAQLLETLVKQGLERLAPEGEAFDPNFHEAVMHEPRDEADEDEGDVVAEVLRTGYAWKGRVLRPAMVKVKG